MQCFSSGLVLNGGTGNAPVSQKLPAGRLLKRPEEPVRRNGRLFIGWYTSRTQFNESTMWDFNKNTIPAKDVTLYAGWATDVQYIDEDGSVVTRPVEEFRYINSSGNVQTLTEGRYFSDGALNLTQGMIIEGDVKIVLPDNSKLNATSSSSARAGIELAGNNRLTIYAQSTGEFRRRRKLAVGSGNRLKRQQFFR